MRNRIIFFSGGKSSFVVADYVKTTYPNDNVVLYFTDTNWEDEDLYRFINEASDKLKLPMLTHSYGINPVQLMYRKRVLFNSRIGECSKVLKMQCASDFIRKGIEPDVSHWRNQHFLKDENFRENAVLYFGIGWHEAHREGAIKKNWQPFEVEMPLIDMMVDDLEVLDRYEIKQPRLYDMGFAHNNCAGRCVKAGQGHYRNLKEQMPETFKELMAQEHYLKIFVSSYHFINRYNNEKYIKKEDYVDDPDFTEEARQIYLQELDDAFRDYFEGKIQKPKVYVPPALRIKEYAFMKKQEGGETRPYTIRQLYLDMQKEKEIDVHDVGGCGCFINFDEKGEEE